MKPVKWLGDARKTVKAFPPAARRQTGIELFAVQMGDNPSDWKPMRPVGVGVNEMRVRVGGEHRVLYVAKFTEAVYVLHAFIKTTQATSLHDVRVARQRYQDMLAQRGKK